MDRFILSFFMAAAISTVAEIESRRGRFGWLDKPPHETAALNFLDAIGA